MKNIFKITDIDTDRVIFFNIENGTITAIDFRQGISDESEHDFEPVAEILEHFNKMYANLENKGTQATENTLKKAVEVYCILNIYE